MIDESHNKWGFPKIMGTLSGGAYNKEFSILGALMGCPLFGKLPNRTARTRDTPNQTGSRLNMPEYCHALLTRADTTIKYTYKQRPRNPEYPKPLLVATRDSDRMHVLDPGWLHAHPTEG